MAAFKQATEARAIDTIWKSRAAGQLRNRPEKVAQLETYMKTEKRSEGWLVVFDARKNKKSTLPSSVKRPTGLVRLVVIDVNPVVPSRRKA